MSFWTLLPLWLGPFSYQCKSRRTVTAATTAQCEGNAAANQQDTDFNFQIFKFPNLLQLTCIESRDCMLTWHASTRGQHNVCKCDRCSGLVVLCLYGK